MLNSLADGENFLQQWKQSHLSPVADFPGIRQLFYAAYEAGQLIESLPLPKSAVPGPLLWIHEAVSSLCVDTKARKLFIASRNRDRLDELMAFVATVAHAQREPQPVPVLNVVEGDAQGYMRAVDGVKDYIAAGDIFQANIARFWRAEMDDSEIDRLYGCLREVNPAPFSTLLSVDGPDGPLHLLSASPERLFSLSAGGTVETRPIAGTRRRGEGEDDDWLRSELLLSDKEQAEHIMLVDLERNDLGRVCRPGSVEVNERMAVEQYSTVQHIVSNVRGELAAGMDLVDLFRAMFPGGTITGCPKVRCMEIIHELETQARGPYTGGVGYVGWNGSADMNILIRTFWHYQGELHWAAGAGIVADSDPAAELEETGHKAAGLLRAIRV